MEIKMTEERGFMVEAVEPDRIQSEVTQHWQNTWKAAGYPEESFVLDWEKQTLEFLKAAVDNIWEHREVRFDILVS